MQLSSSCQLHVKCVIWASSDISLLWKKEKDGELKLSVSISLLRKHLGVFRNLICLAHECLHVKFISVSGIQLNIFKIFFVAGSFQIMNMLRGALPLLRTCKATVWLIKENSESLTSFSKITSGAIITDLWVERVKHVKHGPRNDRKVRLRKMPIGRIFGAQTTCTSAWTTVETGMCSQSWLRLLTGMTVKVKQA